VGTDQLSKTSFTIASGQCGVCLVPCGKDATEEFSCIWLGTADGPEKSSAVIQDSNMLFETASSKKL
jgi:hypothetical protein